ncbi:MAG: hypothetical protein RLZZ338_171, partial [Cyanobacteriota bacterium]
QANPSQLWDFQTYLTQPFQDEQMQQFIQRWFRNLSGEKQDVELAESLWSALQVSGKERIKDLCRNPLRLTLLCPIWQDEQGDLPDTTAELYESFVESIYKWKKKEFPMKKAERDSLNAGLGELAKASLDSEGIRFRLTHRFVCKYLGEPDENSLLDSALKLGWLNEVGVAAENRRERVYAFYHATFQEYFAALAVEAWDYFLPRNHVNFPVAGKEYRIFEPQWKQVILLWLGRGDVADEDKEGFIEALVNFEDEVRDFYSYQAYFLAATGVNEFKASSLATEIVKQVVKWGFGYFNIEKQEWQTFLNPIEEGARKSIPKTIRQWAITELTVILEHCPDQQYIRNIRSWAALNLDKIGQGNLSDIPALVQLLETTEDQHTRWQMAEHLGKIDPGNLRAIEALVKILETAEDQHTRWHIACSLGKIDPGNPRAIEALVEILETAEDQHTRWHIGCSLGDIGQGNRVAITALIQILQTIENEYIRRDLVYSLGKIGRGNPGAITALVELLQTTEDEDIRMQAVYSLGEIGQENPRAIAALVQLLKSTENVDTCRMVAYSLGKINPGNLGAITALVRILEISENEDIRRQVASRLSEIGQGNPEAITALVKLLKTTENENTRREMAYSLGNIGKGHPQIIAALVQFLKTTENKDTLRKVVDSLEKILTTPEQYAGVVSALKDCFSDEVYQNNFKRFDECYKVVWHCAANLPYPEFYQAWHHPPTTPHPEIT